MTRGSPAGKLMSCVPQQLANCLATKANVAQPTPSSDVRERFGTVPTPGGRSLENRLGTRNGL